MKTSTHFKRILLAGVVAAAAAVGSMPGNVHARPNDPAVPTAIKVPAGNKVFLIGHAIGVQIYSCNTRTTGSLTPAAADCNAATEGSRVEVPYTADYHFWNATGR